MKHEMLSFGVEIWVVRQHGFAGGVDYVDGPFRVVAFDREMVYASWKGNGFGEFFPVAKVALTREAAEENLEQRNIGQ